MKTIPEIISEKAIWRYDSSKFHVQTSESGLHSDLYLNTDHVVSDVLLVENIVENIFSKELGLRNIRPDWIISYPPFGLTIAYALARQTGAKFGYVDTIARTCNFDIRKGDMVIVVSDDIYSGGSIKKMIEILDGLGAKVQSPIFTIGNLSGAETLSDLEIMSVISEKGNLYSEFDCPMCKAGSKAVSPRPNWDKLILTK
jgi:orotate phosphoribosyltransferase